MSEPRHLSASQIKTYKTCGKQYWYDKVSDEHEETVISKGYRELGGAVHEAIENYLKSGKPINNRSEIQRGLQIELADADDEYPSEMEEDAQDCIKGASRYLESLDEEIIGVEEEFNFKIHKPGFEEEFIGYADLLTENKIIDWKTGSTIRPMDEKIQGAVYLAGYMNKFGEPPGQIQFVYLKKGETSKHKAVSDDGEVMWDEDTNKYQDTMMQYARSLVDAWEQDKWTPSPERDKCNWCDYRYYCEEGKRGSEHVPWGYFRA